MLYLGLKAAHVVGFVSWFAGLLYIVRLFIYHVEAAARPPQERAVLQEQLALMQRRLWLAITWPAMVLTLAAGLAMVTVGGLWLAPWVHIKLSFVALLVGYHWQCGRILRAQRDGRPTWSSTGLRLWNELGTLLLVLIVLVAVLKSAFARPGVLAVVLAFAAVLASGVALYARHRRRARS